jgi:hypothetical protein
VFFLSLRVWLLVPPLFSKAGSAFHPTTMSVLDYNLFFMLFSFYSEVVLDYVPREWVGKLCMVLVAHLLGLQVYTGSFETSWWGEMMYHTTFLKADTYWDWVQ